MKYLLPILLLGGCELRYHPSKDIKEKYQAVDPVQCYLPEVGAYWYCQDGAGNQYICNVNEGCISARFQPLFEESKR